MASLGYCLNSKLIWLMIIIVFNMISVAHMKKCECPMIQPPAPGVIPPKTFTLVSESYRDAAGTSVPIGIPVVIGKHVFHTKDFTVLSSIISIKDSCPPGYRLPTIVEYQDLLSTLGDDPYTKLQKADGFKGVAGNSYISSTKAYAGRIEGNHPESYQFYGITLDKDEEKVFIDPISTFKAPSTVIARCFLASITYNVDITKDFYYGVEKTVTITNPNSGGNLTNFAQVTSNTITSKLKSKRLGCQLLQSWLRNAAGEIMYQCNKVYVNYRMGTDESTTVSNTLSVNKISTNIKPKQHLKMFNVHSIAAIAPKPKGGFYLLYADELDLYIHVAEYSDTNTLISDNRLSIKGYPLDICALSEGGFAIYLQSAINTNDSFVSFFNEEFIEVYHQVIMNNGQTPSTDTKDQLSFYDSHDDPIWGFNLMSKPVNGRLIEGRGKVGLIFQHQNDFGDSFIASGDSIVILDPKEEPTYSIPWVASPSLEQYMIYDGRFFVTASLGNQSPQNIRVCVSDMINVKSNYDSVNHQYLNNPGKCENVAPFSEVPGDRNDNSCGRLGGLVNMGDKFVLVYGRKYCKFKFDLYDDALILVTFTIDDNMAIKDMKSNEIKSDDIRRLINLKIGKFGDKILILMYLTPGPTPPPPPLPPAIQPPLDMKLPKNEYTFIDEEVHFLYADFNGYVPPGTTPPANPQLRPFPSIPSTQSNQKYMTNEPLRNLKKGNLIWTSIDKTTKMINIYITNDPPQSSIVPDETPSDEIPEEEQEEYIHDVYGRYIHTVYGLLLVLLTLL